MHEIKGMSLPSAVPPAGSECTTTTCLCTYGVNLSWLLIRPLAHSKHWWCVGFGEFWEGEDRGQRRSAVGVDWRALSNGLCLCYRSSFDGRLFGVV